MFNVIVNYDMSCEQLETLRDLLTFSKGGGTFFSQESELFSHETKIRLFLLLGMKNP